MPRLLSLMDAKQRDAEVELVAPARRERLRFVDPDGRPVRHERLVKGTERTTYDALLARYGDSEALGEALVASDPEIDLAQLGRRLRHTSRVYLDPDGQVLHAARVLRVIRDPSGETLRREEFVDVEATVGEDLPPIPWTGRLVAMDAAIRRFAFVRKLQLRHVNGLTFDFLHEMARTLHEAGRILRVGSGPKGRGPLIFRTNGTPFHGFLEGRVWDDAYKLVLHLSNLELKSVAMERAR